MPILKVIAGPDVGKVWVLKEPKSVLGRHPDCDVSVDHLDASRHHAQIVFVNNEAFVEDLHSRNGTFLNDQRVRGRMKLSEGDRVRISESLFEFSVGQGGEVSGAASSILLNDEAEGSKLVVVAEQDGSSGHGTSRSAASIQAELQALLEITRALRNTLSLDQVLPHILDTLFLIFPSADRGFIVLLGEDGSMTPRWAKLRRGDAPGQPIHISRTIVQRAMESQQGILSADAIDDARFKNSESVAADPIRSVMCAPLIDAEGSSFGVLQIDTANYRDRFREDDLLVLIAVATQASIAIENARLHEQALHRRALKRDLELAHQIQQSFLPAQPPEVPGYEFFDYYEPAEHVGGDFYDYAFLPDGRVAVVVADVVGHGLAAAMLTAKLSGEVRSRLQITPQPAEVIRQLNTSLPRGLGEYHFVTMVLVVLAPETGELTIVNAGHVPPILRLSDGEVREIGHGAAGLPLGIAEETVYQQASVQLPPGATLLIYTDGLNESMNPGKEIYGIDRILNEVRVAGGPVEIGRRIIQSVRDFMAGNPQEDDMCLVCFRRL